MGRKQRALGLDRMQIANGGREVEVFQSGLSHLTGHADQDPGELVGMVRALGIRSSMVVPLVVGGVRSGLLLASSATPERFGERDLRVLEAAARWVGMVTHRAELVEQLAREAVERGRRAAADELVTVVAHDLRNYLTPLKARVDLLLRRARRRKDETDAQHAEVASRELDRLSRVIGNLLDVARLEQGVFGVAPQPVDLVALVRETAEGLATAQTPVAPLAAGGAGGGCGAARAGRGGARPGDRHRARPRARHPAGAAAAALRALRGGLQPRGPGPRALPRPAHRRGARGLARRRFAAGAGRQLPLHAAAGRARGLTGGAYLPAGTQVVRPPAL
jgi:hypothetical protein